MVAQLGSDGGGMPESDLISPQGVDNQISVILSSHTNAPLCFLQHHARTHSTAKSQKLANNQRLTHHFYIGMRLLLLDPNHGLN